MDELAKALEVPVSTEETSMAGTYRGPSVDIAMIDEPSEFDNALTNLEEIENVKVKIDSNNEPVKEYVDPTNYDTDKPHILLNSRELLRILSQISPIINENAHRAVFRGITLRISSPNTVEVISPNELYYFSAVLQCESTFEVGETIFIDYKFIQKMAKFMPHKTLIYKDEGDVIPIYYIRMTTEDLELINTQLIDSDKKKLDYDYKPVDELKVLEPAPLLSALNTLSVVVNFESDSNRKEIRVVDGHATFKSPLVQARSNTELINSTYKLDVIKYIIKTIGLLSQGEKITIKSTDSVNYTRYAICTDNSVMITNYSDATEDERLKELFDTPPEMTLIDYGKLKYQLDYANSISYALGTIKFEVSNGKLSGKIKLNNNNFSPLDIPLLGDFKAENGKTFNINTKTFLSSLNSLDSSLSTSIGYKDGYLYLSNDNITLILLTI